MPQLPNDLHDPLGYLRVWGMELNAIQADKFVVLLHILAHLLKGFVLAAPEVPYPLEALVVVLLPHQLQTPPCDRHGRVIDRLAKIGTNEVLHVDPHAVSQRESSPSKRYSSISSALAPS